MKGIRKVSVSIGIPALNEEANIKTLLLNLLAQNKSSYILKQIIVVSDGSTDNTVKEILSVKSNKIVLIKNRKRIGQALSQNKIVAKNSSEILVLLNADVLPKDSQFIDSIIEPLLDNTRVGLVGAKVEPVGSETFVGRIIDFSAEVKNGLYLAKNNGNNIYSCHGRARAFRKELLVDFRWQKAIAEDAYSYLSCIQSGYLFSYQPNAVVLYKSPQTIRDHFKQSIRFIQSKTEMKHYFDEKLVTLEYHFSYPLILGWSIYYFLKNPLLFISYSIIYTVSKIRARFDRLVSATWEVSSSSKVVVR